jgi:membrane protease YdiL (CAAX protease family)
MTTTLAQAGIRPAAALRPWVEIGLLAIGLGAIALARLAATRAGLDALAVGAAFGAALVALGLASGAARRLGPIAAKHLALGAGFGLALVAATVAGAAIGGAALVPGLGRPAAPFAPWAAITVVVAVGEEVILRGALFDRIRRVRGPLAAVLLTSAAFAVMHVPLYGWHVVPLDLAVGIGLGGLRIATRGIVAPAIAHAVAGLATWWL